MSCCASPSRCVTPCRKVKKMRKAEKSGEKCRKIKKMKKSKEHEEKSRKMKKSVEKWLQKCISSSRISRWGRHGLKTAEPKQASGKNAFFPNMIPTISMDHPYLRFKIHQSVKPTICNVDPIMEAKFSSSWWNYLPYKLRWFFGTQVHNPTKCAHATSSNFWTLQFAYGKWKGRELKFTQTVGGNSNPHLFGTTFCTDFATNKQWKHPQRTAAFACRHFCT